jgi:hypothetical protein
MSIGSMKVDIFLGNKQSGSERKRPNATGTAGDKSSHSLERPSRAFTTALHQYLQLSLSLSLPPCLIGSVSIQGMEQDLCISIEKPFHGWDLLKKDLRLTTCHVISSLLTGKKQN